MSATSIPHDPALPAAVHLAGDGARDLLATALTYGDGELLELRPCHVQYRPGSDAVVRYDAQVSWSGAAPVRETLVAGVRRDGLLDGTVPVVASHRGVDLEVGVWRWPFDPLLPALTDAVTPSRCGRMLGSTSPVDVDVVAYRPTERAVIRVRDAAGVVCYLKVLPPDHVGALVERHERLLDAGVPVPTVLDADADTGWIALAELAGDTVRDRLKGRPGAWPEAAEYTRLFSDMRSADLGDRRVPSRVADAAGHAAMLSLVAPQLAPRLEQVARAIQPEIATAESRRAPVHGDVHEAQLVLDGSRIAGLLDIDDAGCGDPLDDFATVLGHLHFRRLTAPTPSASAALEEYVDALTAAFAIESRAVGADRDALHRVTAAGLVGLATGPFRVQQAGWMSTASAVVAQAELLLSQTGMREVSARPHRPATAPCEK